MNGADILLWLFEFGVRIGALNPSNPKCVELLADIKTEAS
jgi:hypothetical protein